MGIFEEARKPEVDPKQPRRNTKAAVQRLLDMIEARDHRLNGRTTRMLADQLDLTQDKVLEVLHSFPAVMRLRETTNLWGILPTAE